ncbi:hypothetical protein Y025_6266 [Burkholderia pseudomallei TSV32]|nr:hypothetical protein Y025_6266 [Burkholderia pseudomallei TSV32]
MPPTFDTEPAPLPSVSVPVPACVIVPPSFTSAAGANVRSALLVCSVPPRELSSVPVTLTAIAPFPVCVIVPPWFTTLVAVNETWSACTVPELLSSVVPVSAAVWPTMLPPPLARCVPASTVTPCAAWSAPPLLSTDCPETWRLVLDVIVAWFAILPPWTVTSPLPPITPPCAPFAVVPATFVSWPVAVSTIPSVLSDVMRPAVLSIVTPSTVAWPALWIVPWLFATVPPRSAIVLSDTSTPA